MELTDREKAIRAAAIIDTDGTININQFQVRCAVLMTQREMIDWLQSEWGGSVYTNDRQQADGIVRKTRYQWVVTTKKADKFLRDIYPFLMLKKQQADCAFDLRQQQVSLIKIPPKNGRNIHLQPFVERMKELNK